MAEAQCPVCASQKFFVKNEDDEFDVYDFEINEGQIVFAEGVKVSQAPSMKEDTATYCSRCSWHGALGALRKGS